MKKLFQTLFFKKQEGETSFKEKNSPHSDRTRERKDAAFQQVGKRYGRALTRLSDT